jgi:hypothetical protein
MQRFLAFAPGGLDRTFPIWEPARIGGRFAGATAALRALAKRSGSERAAEAPLGARE